MNDYAIIFGFGAAIFLINSALNKMMKSSEERHNRLLQELERIRALLQNLDGSSSLKNVELMIDRELERRANARSSAQLTEVD